MKKKLIITVIDHLFNHRRKFFALLNVFFLLFFNLTAANAFTADIIQKEAKITIKQRNVTISKVLDEIGHQTGYSIIIRENDVNTRERVTIDETEKSVEEVLAVLFKGKDITYEIEDNTISIYKPNIRYVASPEQTRPVTGTVKDKLGDPLIGVNVKILGAQITGTITDIDGNYSLANVPAGAVLEFSYVGMTSKEVKVGNLSVINVVLEEDAVGLDEVVVIGYMAQRKGLLTGSVATMKVDESMKALPTTAAGNMLVGKLAGVNVSTPNSIPGSNPDINIRTHSSWKKDDKTPIQPVIYVIDGIVRGGGDFNNLSPNEIEDITVLKDAASAAIYGSRSAGGVIIVTTKKGNRGKPIFDYSYGYSFDTRTKNMDLTSAVQAGEMYTRINGSADPAGWAWSQDEIDHYKTINNGWGYDQLKAVWQSPTTQTHNLSVSGGNDRVRYFGGASYVKQQGFLDPMKYDKYNIRMNVTADITKDFEVFTSFALYNNIKGNIADGADPSDTYGKLRIWQPDQPVYTDNGQYVDYGWIGNVGARVAGASGYNKDDHIKPQLIVSGTYKMPFLKGLSAKVTYSRSWTNNVNKKYYTNYDMMVMKKSGTNGRIISTDDNDIVSVRRSTWVGKEYIERNSTWSNDTQFNVQLNYQNVFKDVHRVSAALITEWHEGGGAGVKGGRETFPVYTTDQFWAASGARTDTWGDGDTDWKDGRMSYIGQFSYSYADKYLLNFSFREDGSMKFAPNQRWGFFPAASVGWVISEENFFKQSAVQFLKLRASVGLTGDDSVGGWQWQESYKADGKNAYFGQTPSQSVGITYGSVVNPNLTWEKSLSYNVGVDMNFLNNWNMSVDYWYRNTHDILAKRTLSLPSTFSLELPEENYGKMWAQGFDFQLGYQGKTNKFSYFANLTMSYGWNKVIRKDHAENAQWVTIDQGKSLSYIRGWAFDKILRTQADLDAFVAANPNYKHKGLSPELGMIVYKDLSGPNGTADGIIDDWDRVILKNNNFPVVYGLNLGGSWKGLSVDMMFSGKLGEKKWMKDLADGVEWNRMWNQWYYDSWTPETPNATLPKRISSNSEKTYNIESSFWLKNADFMRLKYLTVSYDLPKGQFYNSVFDNVRLFVTGTNLFVLSSFNKNYYDPEIGGGNAFPVLRSWNFGINVKF